MREDEVLERPRRRAGESSEEVEHVGDVDGDVVLAAVRSNLLI